MCISPMKVNVSSPKNSIWGGDVFCIIHVHVHVHVHKGWGWGGGGGGLVGSYDEYKNLIALTVGFHGCLHSPEITYSNIISKNGTKKKN